MQLASITREKQYKNSYFFLYVIFSLVLMVIRFEYKIIITSELDIRNYKRPFHNSHLENFVKNVNLQSEIGSYP